VKGKTVHSILKQIYDIGGRFLQRHPVHTAFWIPMSKKLARQKIAHALRDKSPISELTRSTFMRKILTDGQSSKGNLPMEDILDQINAILLRVIVPEQECINDQCMEDILMDEVEKLIKNHTTKVDSSILEGIDDRGEESTRLDDIETSQTQSIPKSKMIDGIPKANGTMKQQDEPVTQAAVPASCKCNVVTWKPRHKGYSFELENEACISSDNDAKHNNLERKLEFKVNIVNATMNDELFTLSGDLPMDFSEHDFEYLVASLDNISEDDEVFW
jgi:hypothetical protein